MIDLDRMEIVAGMADGVSTDQRRTFADLSIALREFYAEFTPPVVLAMIAEVRRLRSENERLDGNAIAEAECLKAYQQDVDDHIIAPRDAEIASLGANLAEAVEALKDAVEGQEIAEQLADNIRSHGAYSDGSLITFLGQISMGAAASRAIVAKHGGKANG